MLDEQLLGEHIRTLTVMPLLERAMAQPAASGGDGIYRPVSSSH